MYQLLMSLTDKITFLPSLYNTVSGYGGKWMIEGALEMGTNEIIRYQGNIGMNSYDCSTLNTDFPFKSSIFLFM